MNQTEARYMSYVGTGKLPTIDATAQDVTPANNNALYMPILANDSQKANPLNLSALWAGLVNGWRVNVGRNFQSVTADHVPTVTPKTEDEPKPEDGGASFTEAPKP